MENKYSLIDQNYCLYSIIFVIRPIYDFWMRLKLIMVGLHCPMKFYLSTLASIWTQKIKYQPNQNHYINFTKNPIF